MRTCLAALATCWPLVLPATPQTTRAAIPLASQPVVQPTSQPGSQPAARARVQERLDALRAGGRFPGATAGVVLADGTALGFATGLSDRERNTPMRPDDRMLAGSVGKTFFAALALQLVAEHKLLLDARVSVYLGRKAWYPRLPNAAEVTVRMLMNHTSGIMRYEFKPEFTKQLTANPDRTWQPAELLAFVLDERAPFAAGQGWEYSDTNYIVLALILEQLTGARAYDAIQEHFLGPLGLAGVVPSDRRDIPGLVQGYAGHGNPFGGVDGMVVEGRLAIHPQFEWAGGGYATTAPDLARWTHAVHTGKAFPMALLAEARAGVPSKLGKDVRYGLGMILWPTPLGPARGHSGFFPGYLTETRHYVDHGLTVAVQVNTSVGRALGRPLGAMVDALAEAALGIGERPR